MTDTSLNLSNSILHWSICHAQVNLLDYMGYPFLLYLLCHALDQTTHYREILEYSALLDPYDFSLALHEWLDLEGIQAIQRCYTNHFFSHHYLEQLPHAKFPGVTSLLCDVNDSKKAKTSLTASSTLHMLLNTVSTLA